MSSRANRLVIVPPEILHAPMRAPGQTNNQMTISAPKNIDSRTKRSTFLQKRPYIISQVELMCSNRVSDLDVYHVLNLYIKEAETPEDFDTLNSAIFQKMLQDPVNAVPICKYMFIFGRDKVKGQMLRNSFFKFLEQFYKDCQKLRTVHGTNAYKNFIWFFAAATHHNRNVFVAPFEDLISGILALSDSLRSLLQTPQDIKLLCLLVTRFAQYCQMTNIGGKDLTINALSPLYLDIKNTVRTLLSNASNNKLDQKVIIWLMLALEDSVRFDSSTRKFYVDILNGEDIIDFVPDVLHIQIPLADKNSHEISHVSSIINYI